MDEHDRLLVLERDVAHIDKTLSEVKADMKSGFAEINKKFDTVNAQTGGVKDSIASAKIWALVLYVALAAGLLGSMGTGFFWLANRQDKVMEQKPEGAASSTQGSVLAPALQKR